MHELITPHRLIKASAGSGKTYLLSGRYLSLLRDGATHFCWLNAGEELKAGDTSWMPSKEGAFLYRRKDAAPLFFPVRAAA